jgi:two-component system sensor histidine kinase ChvG
LRILQALYALRLGVFRVFLGSLGVAIVLSLLVSRTIARPLRALRDQAERVVDRRGRWRGHFALPPRGDEIGDLAGALEALRERLEERVRDAEAFASDVAHEFRNPLAAIRTAAEMIHAAEKPRDRSRFMQLIEHEVARLEKMLTSLRELGRLDAGICDEPREPIDLAALAEGVAKQHIRATGRELRLRLEGCEHSVEASPLRLEQVLDNLLANAESFSPPGAPIDLEVVEAGPQVVLRVLDRGPGIPAAHRERVFERFFSYRPGLDEVKTHAGLGLSIVRAIINSEGGQISSCARPGGGGLLEVRLPSVSSCCSAPGRASAR